MPTAESRLCNLERKARELERTLNVRIHIPNENKQYSSNVKIVAQDHMTFLLVVNTLREVLRVEIEALVEADYIGLIIGKQGATIKVLQDMYGVKIDKSANGFRLTGEREKCNQCKELIMEFLGRIKETTDQIDIKKSMYQGLFSRSVLGNAQRLACDDAATLHPLPPRRPKLHVDLAGQIIKLKGSCSAVKVAGTFLRQFLAQLSEKTIDVPALSNTTLEWKLRPLADKHNVVMKHSTEVKHMDETWRTENGLPAEAKAIAILVAGSPAACEDAAREAFRIACDVCKREAAEAEASQKAKRSRSPLPRRQGHHQAQQPQQHSFLQHTQMPATMAPSIALWWPQPRPTYGYGYPRMPG